MSRPALIVLGVAGALLLGLFGVGGWLLSRVFDIPAVAGRHETAEAAAREAGLPWTAEDLRPPEPVPEAQNAASDLRALHQAVEPVRQDPAAHLRDEDYLSRDPPVMERVLRSHAATLAAVERMATKPKLDMNRDWGLGMAILLPEYASVRTAGRVLQARASQRIMRGDLPGALEDTTRIRKVARLVAQESALISLLVGLMVHALAYEPEERLAAAWAGEPRRLEAQAAAIRRHGPPDDFTRALHGEFHFTLWGLRNPRQAWLMEAPLPNGKGEGQEEAVAIDPATLRRDGWPPGFRDRAVMVRVVEVWTETWPVLERYADAPFRQDEILRAMEGRVQEGPGLSGRLAQAHLPYAITTGQDVAEAQARDGALRGLIAALRSRAATGRWPATLAAAGFDEADPFGRRYVLRASGGTALVYSLGSDGQDDGGVTLAEARRARPGPEAERGAPKPGERFDIPARFPPAPRPARAGGQRGKDL
jgi:hypothetical protein